MTTEIAPAIEEVFFLYSEQARLAGDDTSMHAFDKAAAQWAKGVRPIESGETFLVESRTDASQVYRVRKEGGVWSCNCRAGLSGRGCWHVALTIAAEEAPPQQTTSEAVSTPGAPLCCGAPMRRDTACWYCVQCRYWTWID